MVAARKENAHLADASRLFGNAAVANVAKTGI
jgi:hypothetical protein